MWLALCDLTCLSIIEILLLWSSVSCQWYEINLRHLHRVPNKDMLDTRVPLSSVWFTIQCVLDLIRKTTTLSPLSSKLKFMCQNLVVIHNIFSFQYELSEQHGTAYFGGAFFGIDNVYLYVVTNHGVFLFNWEFLKIEI